MDLNKDGLILDLYHLLWKSEDFLRGDAQSFRLNIPQTLIIKESQPFAWYFTDSAGLLRKRRMKNLNLTEILKAFGSNPYNTDVVAYFIHQKRAGNSEEYPSIKKERICIQYFSQGQLHDFLFSEGEEKNGILQKFIPSYEENHSLMEIIWSPYLCIFSKKTNLKNFNNPQYDKYERCSTFEGPEHFCANTNIHEQKVTDELKSVADMIAAKIANISYDMYEINRLILYFKRDKNKKVFFLFCTSARTKKTQKKKKETGIMNRNPDSIEIQNVFKWFESANKHPNFDSKHPHQLLMDVLCYGCLKNSSADKMMSVPYEDIIKYDNFWRNIMKMRKKFAHDLTQDLQRRDPNNKKTPNLLTEYEEKNQVPMFFQNLYPAMNLTDYQRLVNDPTFQNKTFLLCEDCFFEITRFMRDYGSTTTKFQIKFGVLQEALRADPILKSLYAKNKLKTSENQESTISETKEEETVEGLTKTLGVTKPRLVSEENISESQSFMMKKVFFPTSSTKRVSTGGSTRPQTSNSRSIQSIKISKIIETPSKKKKNGILGTINRPNSAVINFHTKTIKEELQKTAYLMSSLEKDRETNQAKSIQSAKIEKRNDVFQPFASVPGERCKTESDVFERFPQFRVSIQKSLLRDLKDY